MKCKGGTGATKDWLAVWQYGPQILREKAWGSVPKRDRIVGIIAPGNWEKICVYQSQDTKNDKSKRSTDICKEG